MYYCNHAFLKEAQFTSLSFTGIGFFRIHTNSSLKINLQFDDKRPKLKNVYKYEYIRINRISEIFCSKSLNQLFKHFKISSWCILNSWLILKFVLHCARALLIISFRLSWLDKKTWDVPSREIKQEMVSIQSNTALKVQHTIHGDSYKC
jgi:hypothetical protein